MYHVGDIALMTEAQVLERFETNMSYKRGKQGSELLTMDERRSRIRSAAHVYQLLKGARIAEMIPNVDTSIRALCICCEKSATLKCAGCQSAGYCSHECQKKDWSIHKHLCKNYLAKFADGRRPLPKYVRGICFPDDKAAPEHVWVEQPYACINGVMQTYEWLEKTIGRFAEFVTMSMINDFLSITLHQDIGHGLMMLNQTAAPPDSGFPLNMSIMALGAPGHMAPWFGKRVIVGAVLDKTHHTGTRILLADTNFRDLRHAVDNFQNWPWNPAVINAEKMKTVDKVFPGLLLHCDGSFHRHHPHGLQSRVEKIPVRLYSGHDPKYENKIVQVDCLAAKQVGLDWVVRRYPSTREFEPSAHNPTTLRNDMAVNLVPTNPVANAARNVMIDADVNKVVIGSMNIGTVVLLDRRGGQVEPEHLECLNAFIKSVKKYQKHDKVIWDDGVQMLWVGPEECGQEAAKKAFTKFWKTWKKVKKAVESVNLDNMPSPYKIRGQLEEGDMSSDKLEKGLFNATIIPDAGNGSVSLKEVMTLREGNPEEIFQKETAEHAQENVPANAQEESKAAVQEGASKEDTSK